MSIKEENERISITFDKVHKEKLLYLCNFFKLSKTNTLNKLVDYMYEKLK